MKFRFALLSLCLISAVASAADNGFYLGAGALRSKYDLDNPLDSKDTGFKLIAGVRLLDSFGVEVNYADFGKATVPSGTACMALVGANCPGNTNVEGKATTAFAVGFLDFPLLDLFAKVGLSMADGKLRVPSAPSFNQSDKSTDVVWGLGAQAHFGSLGARAEYERFKLFGDEKLDIISVSLLYTFL
jgi:opacity protein-like surface antigen